MNNYKKIYIVNEFNDEKNEYDIKTIVIFRDDDAPIIENYDSTKHLPMINDFLVNNDFDLLTKGVNEAINDGLLSVVSRTNSKDMSILTSEIIQEQIKYSVKDEIKEEEKEDEEEKVESVEDKKSIELDAEDRELANYFRLAMLRDNGQLPPVGLAEIERLASVNERAAALEEANKRLKDGRLSQAEYDRLYSTYRAQLAQAIKDSSVVKKEEEKVEKVEFSPEDKQVYDSLMETIDLCRDARVNDEKFEIVIDRGLNDNSKREVRISLLNGFARDSYTFEFTNGEVFDQYLEDIIARASIEDKVVDVAVTPTELSSRTSNSISLYTTENGNQVLIRYSLPSMVLVHEKEINPKELVAEQEMEEPKVEKVNTVSKKRIDLSEEDRQLADYFRKDILRSRGQLPPVGLAEIERLASVNERVAALEEARKNLNEGKISLNTYDEIRSRYRAQLADAIKNASLLSKENIETAKTNEQVYQKRLALSKDDRELADYYRKKILRDNGQLPPVGLAEIERLANINERVAALEEAVNRLNEGKLSKEAFEELNSTYRKQLASAIKEASLNNNYENVVQDDNKVVIEKDVANVVENDDTNEQDVEKFDENDDVQKMVDTNNKVEDEPVPSEIPTPVIPLPTEDEKDLEDGAVDAEYTVKSDEENVESDDEEEQEKDEDNEISAPIIVPVPVSVPKNTDSLEEQEEGIDEEKEEVKPIEKEKQPYFSKETKDSKKIDDSKPVQVKGKIVVNPKEEEEVVLESGKGKVKKTNKLKQLGKYILAGLAGIAGYLAGKFAFENVKKMFQHNNQTQVGQNTTIDNKKELVAFIDNYGKVYNVPAATMNFLMTDEVTTFLSQYKSSDQISEVLSALCYGYEANVLTTKDGNFRLREDGTTYLRSFTNDFLCAKVVVNGYTPEQMLAVFGNTDMSYERLMDGFKGYLNTVSLYGTTAVEPLPFKYLTNNDAKATEALNNLFSKLSVVNANRKAGTLNSLHTDAFIVAVDELFVQNDQSLGLSEGTKMVAAALVDSYLYSQAQVSNGEALYLHADYGLAKAGLNLQEVDGHFAIVSRDGTAYHFTNLLDVVNYGYGNAQDVNNRCLNEQRVLLENLNQMNNLSSTNERTARITLANALYQNGLKEYADRVNKGDIDESLLRTIEMLNPGLADEIDAYEASAKLSSNSYVSYQITVDGVDELLGIKGLTNDLASLHNIRRNMLYLYNDYDIVNGKRYTGGSGGYSYGGGSGSISVPSPTVTVTTETVQVDYEDLTPEEQVQVQQQVEQMQQQEQQQHQQQMNLAQQGVNALQAAVANGATQQELEVLGQQYGIDVDDDYQANMSAALAQQQAGEELAGQVDAENERRNEAARREAEERARREAEEQARRRAEQEALIGGGTTTPPSGDSQIDDGYVDEDAGEEPYVGDEEGYTRTVEGADAGANVVVTDPEIDPFRVDEGAGEEPYEPSATVGELTTMREALATAIAIEDLGLDAVPEAGRSLGKSRNC